MESTAKQERTEEKSIFSSPRAYAAAAGATLPAAAARTVSGIPIKTLEGTLVKKLEGRLHDVPKVTTSAAVKAGLRRSLSSAIGGGVAGAALMPAYVSGIKKLQSDDPSERKKGYAMLAGQGIAFSAIKGLAEAAGEAKKAAPRAEIIGKFKGKLGGAALVGVPALLLSSRSVAKAQKNLENSKSNKDAARSLLEPALVSGAVSAGAGAIESIIENTRKLPDGTRKATIKQMLSKPGLRMMAPKALGYGAAGVLGGALSALITNKALKDTKKKGM